IEEGSVVPVKIRGFNAVRWYYIIYPEHEKLTFLASRFMKFLLSKASSELVAG
ncbi:MAG: LysR family transcriptional regulator, partial [Aquificota bacterium]